MNNLVKGLIFLSLCLSVFCFYKCSIFYDPPIIPTCPEIEEDCGTENTSLDTLGRRYVDGELVLSFPQKTDMIDSGGNLIDENYIRNAVKNAYQQVKKDIISIHSEHPIDSIIITKCICDDNIFLIQSDSLIGGETNVAEATNANEEIRREGGIFSLNFLIQNDNEKIPKGIVTASEIPVPNDSFAINTAKPIVAILDSGIDFSKFPDHSGIYLKKPIEDTICSIPDELYGYNFIGDNSPNDQVQDLNGHGTIVSSAYKSKLMKLPSVGWNDQRMLIVRVLDKCGNGTSFSTSCGLSYARQKKASIINCSWGLYFNDYQVQRAIDQIPYTTALVCSAGNSKRNLADTTHVHYPSGYGYPFQANNLPPLSPPVFPSTYLVNGNPKANLYEVMALDHKFDYACSPSPVNQNNAIYSNKRPESFAEPANNVQTIIPNNSCPFNEIEGTSFAAPAMSAGVVHMLTTVGTINIAHARGISIPVGTNNYFYTRRYCQ